MNFKILKKFENNKSALNVVKETKDRWQKRETDILREILRITNLNLNTKSITCYIDPSNYYGYYGGRTITLGVKGGITADDTLMVIAHELFHIYYWRKIKKMNLTKSSPENESKQEWNLAEVTAFLLTNEPSLMKYWPNAEVHLYPEIKDTYTKVKKFWKAGDFESYITRAYAKQN